MSDAPERNDRAPGERTGDTRHPFLLGRRAGEAWTLWFLDAARPPLRGPWTLTLLTFRD